MHRRSLYEDGRYELGVIDIDEVLKVTSFSPGHREQSIIHLTQVYKTNLIPKFRLRVPTLRVKTVTDSGDLLAPPSFNPATTITPYPANVSGSIPQLVISSWHVRDAGQPRL